ncbi:hypothetical protein GCM10027562_44280 [Arthrobacter pigmenti]
MDKLRDLVMGKELPDKRLPDFGRGVAAVPLMSRDPRGPNVSANGYSRTATKDSTRVTKVSSGTHVTRRVACGHAESI